MSPLRSRAGRPRRQITRSPLDSAKVRIRWHARDGWTGQDAWHRTQPVGQLLPLTGRAMGRPREVSSVAPCYVHPMPLDGVYGDDWLAAGYATSRPPVHSHILDRVEALHSIGQVELALDVGCGAGISTIALMERGIGTRVLGIDRSPVMIRRAVHDVESASFLLATAEALPLRSGAVGLMTAAGSANYPDLSAFFAEATRVLSPDGFLVVYDFGPGRSSAKCPELTSWYSRFLRRWPKPTQGMVELEQATFESVRMDLMSYERFTVVGRPRAERLPRLPHDREQLRRRELRFGAGRNTLSV